ncbi:MAG: TIGR03557 family F420-dependent LLM class oxidoreductase [Actinobacteria bacterium]|jgi:coenzyme F420-dependent glucose-6-phosphate dehydrogenase|nr:TIGR03557 family F420-dependent LLM class oxidoreductase [Actinomycetota bacterium]
MQIGYKLSSEEHDPSDLVRYATRAESIGMRFALISDHFHPWIDRQGQSPFVWATLGGIAHATSSLRVGTAVTCPTIRIHPAIVAQAAATIAVMMPDRFFLGVGTGENLNEHVLGDKWPAVDTRLEMLEEAVGLMRELWTGKQVSFKGTHFVAENARLYTGPDNPIDVIVAASGKKAGALAGKIGDGLMGVAPQEEVLQTFDDHGGSGKPRYAEVQVCWAESEAEARRVAHEWWPNVGIKGQLSQELPLPAHFDQAAEMVTEEDVAESVSCGPDPEVHIDGLKKFADAGFDHLAVHQIGPNQGGFFDFYEKEVLARL